MKSHSVLLLLFATLFADIVKNSTVRIGQSENLILRPNSAISETNERFLKQSQFVYHAYQAGPAYCTPSSPFLYPKSISEIQGLVRTAGILRKTLKPLGSRHSSPDIICTDGTPMDMCNFKEMVLHRDGSATFGAGVLAGDASIFLKERGRAFIHIPAYDGITIGGAIGTGAHGSSLRHPASFSEQVIRLRVIDGLGQIRAISAGWELDIFRVHLGLLGVVIDVTFTTVPLFKMVVESTPESEHILLDGTLLSMAEKYDYFQAAWWPSKETVVVMKGYPADPSTPGNSVWALFTESTEADSIQERDINEALHATRNIPGFIALEDNTLLSFYTKVVGRVPIQTEDYKTLTNPGIGYGFKFMSASCHSCDWQYGNNSAKGEDNSVACPLEELPGIVKTIKSILARNPAGLSRIQIRFQPPARGLLSIAYGRRSVIFSILYPARNDPNKSISGLATYQAITQALIQKHGGRPHWGKNGHYYHSFEMMHKTIPYTNWKTFSAAVYYYDPFSVFSNKFSRRFLGLSNQVDRDPSLRHCALVDDCQCRMDTDCDPDAYQTCSELRDVDQRNVYRVCRDTQIYHNKPVRGYDPYNFTSIVEAIFY